MATRQMVLKNQDNLIFHFSVLPSFIKHTLKDCFFLLSLNSKEHEGSSQESHKDEGIS